MSSTAPVSRSHAVLVGVERCSDPQITPVAFAHSDAEALRDALQPLGFEQDIELLTGAAATKTGVEFAVQQACQRAGADDVLLLFFAGHGFSAGGQNFLACHDTRASGLVQTSVPWDALLDQLRHSRCQRALIFVDACHEGFPVDADADSDANTHDHSERNEANAPGITHFKVAAPALCDAEEPYPVVFTSCGDKQLSFPGPDLAHGIWAHHLLQALRGAAPDALQDGHLLTVHGLATSLAAEVPRTLRKAHNDHASQGPMQFGGSSGEDVVADLGDLLAQTAEPERGALIGATNALMLRSTSRARLKTLRGFKAHFSVPKEASAYSNDFVKAAAAEDLESWGEELFAEIKRSFRYKRLDVSVEYSLGAVGIITPDFAVTLTVAIDEEAPASYVLTTELSEFADPQTMNSTPFNDVFGESFKSLVMHFDGAVDVPALIDVIEAADVVGIELSYPSDCSVCTLAMDGASADITFDSQFMILEMGSLASGAAMLMALRGAREMILGRSDVANALPSHSGA
ncbi:MAG: hypothetical protein ACI9EF_002144 [Pseudohongiellaceae bacterium]|jgi:hypothetical protein